MAMHLERQGSSQISVDAAPQKLTISGSSGASSAFGAQTYQIRVMADTLCFIVIGKSPTATTSSTPIPANWPEYFTVAPGMAIAVIGTSGNLYVSEMA
jgi:hypothetical protein